MHDKFDDRDDQDVTEATRPETPWPAGGEPPRRPRQRYRAALIVTAVLAAGAGFLVVTAVRDVTDSHVTDSPAAASPSASPTAAAPSYSSGGGAAPNGGAIPTPGPGEQLRLQIAGKVTGVSATSITLTSGGQQVTAAVTSSTRVTGRVTRIGGVKKGDLVSVQITGSNGKLTASAIQDPASLP
jgi:hypothetical protein